MALSFLLETAQTAGTAMVLAALSCLLSGMIAMLLMFMPGDPRAPRAFRLTRLMALFGGAMGIIGAMSGVPYFWLAGEIGGRTCLLLEMFLLGLAGVWAVVAALLLTGDEPELR